MLHPIPNFSLSDHDISAYVGLKPHPDYALTNGDSVRYLVSNNNGQPVYQYCILAYYPPVTSFVLVNYADSSYQELLPEDHDMTRIDFLHEVGIDHLEKI